MDAFLITISTVGAIAFFALGVPILLCIGLWVVAASLITGFTIANIGVTAFEGINSFALLAMPLFILTGDLIREAGIAKRMAKLAYETLGWIRGGLGMATIAACGMFAAISGSNSATTATIGSIMHPEMKKSGYNPSFSAATAAAGGTVGIIIPPSIIFIIYGFLLNLSIADLFLAGLLPGLIMVFCMMLACHIVCRINKWGTIQVFSPKRVAKAAWDSNLGFIAIFVVLYGIYTGKFSPTEAAGVMAGFCLLSGLFLTRKIRFRNIPRIMLRSGQVNGFLASP